MVVKQQDNGQNGTMFAQPRKKVGWLDTTTKIATPILGALSWIPGFGKFAEIGSNVLNGVNNAINGDDVPNKDVGNKINQAQQQQKQEQEDKMAQMREQAAAAAKPAPNM